VYVSTRPAQIGASTASRFDLLFGSNVMSSLEHKLAAVRGPWIPVMTLDVEIKGQIHKQQLPFVVGILADFNGDSAEPLTPLSGRAFLDVDRDNFDEVMAGLQPALDLEVEDRLSEGGARLRIALRFRTMEDFRPEGIVRQVEPLHEWLEVRLRLRELVSLLDRSDRIEEILRDLLHDTQRRDQLRGDIERYLLEAEDDAKIDPGGAPGIEDAAATHGTMSAGGTSLLDDLCCLARPAGYRDRQSPFSRLLACFLDQFPLAAEDAAVDLEAMIKGRIAEIDAALSQQLNPILHHGAFQQLEAAWRGLHYLVYQSETSVMLKIRILNVSRRELQRDLDESPGFGSSALYRLLRQSGVEFSRSEPFGLLVGDFEFGRQERDMALLEWISHIGAAAHAPFLAAAGPAMFGLERFANLSVTRGLAERFDDTVYAAWHRFRDSEDSRYVGLCVPPILLRRPYGPDWDPVKTFQFIEDVSSPDRSGYLWGNAAFALVARLTAAFARYHWFARIRGIEGVKVEGLPVHEVRDDHGVAAVTGPTEVWLNDIREYELHSLGFIPLVAIAATREAVFFSVSTCHRSRARTALEGQAPPLDSLIPHVMGAARFAHYIERIASDPKTAPLANEHVEAILNRWIADYIAPESTSDPRVRGRRPLNDARIVATDSSGYPGRFVVADLILRAELDEPPTSIRVVIGPIPLHSIRGG
jgi:type VI secretion system protein ImpC